MDKKKRHPGISRELLQRISASTPYGMSSTAPEPLAPSPDPRKSFQKRKQIDKNRQVVGGYKASHIGNQVNRPSSIRQMGAEMGRNTPRHPQEKTPEKKISTGQNRPSAGFSEPPSRRYNPFS